jgi:hypothetical protein
MRRPGSPQSKERRAPSPGESVTERWEVHWRDTDLGDWWADLPAHGGLREAEQHCDRRSRDPDYARRHNRIVRAVQTTVYTVIDPEWPATAKFAERAIVRDRYAPEGREYDGRVIHAIPERGTIRYEVEWAGRIWSWRDESELEGREAVSASG